MFLTTTEEIEIHKEFSEYIKHDESLKSTFEKINPGRQRTNILYFAGAKQSKARVHVLEKKQSADFRWKGFDC